MPLTPPRVFLGRPLGLPRIARIDHPRALRGVGSGALLLFALWFCGCGPRGACPAYPHTSPSAALDAHREARAVTRVVRAEARVDTRGHEGRVRGTVMMFLERPDRVRFDVLTQFGAAAVLTSDGERFQLADLRENRFLEGPTCPSNIARLLGVSLEGAEVARFLMGDTPRLAPAEASMVCEGSGYTVTLRAPDGRRQELAFLVPTRDRNAPPAQQRLRLVRSQLFDADGTVWRVTYDDYRAVRDGEREVELPFVVHFEDERHDADTLVRFREIALNVTVPTNAFSQQPTPGLASEYVACDPE
ncbi:MAG: hypothetical protein R3B40_18720 [Polyangiales bacterium]